MIANQDLVGGGGSSTTSAKRRSSCTLLGNKSQLAKYTTPVSQALARNSLQ